MITIPQADAAIAQVHAAYAGRKGERGQLALMAAAIGQLPEVRRMVCDFGDRKLYPERPALLLHDAHPAVYLLGWREGDWTDIHDHGETQVGIYTVCGVVTEDLYSTVIDPATRNRHICLDFSRNLRQGDLATCTRNYVHRVGNMFPETAATLHVYGPTLDDMNLYDLQGAVLKFRDHWHATQEPQH